MTDTLPQIRAILESSSLPFEVLHCDPEKADTADFCQHYNVPADHSANTILVRSKKGELKFALCVLLANYRLNVNHTVRKKLESRKVSFATAEETRELTGMEIGGVTPISLAPSVPIWVDENVMSKEYIILGGGNRSSKLKVSPELLTTISHAEVVADLALAID